VSSVPFSARASCQGKRVGSEKGRRVDAHGAVLVWAIMQPPSELVIAVEIRAFIGVSSASSGALSG